MRFRHNPEIPEKATGPRDVVAIKRIRKLLSVAYHPDKLMFRFGREATPQEKANATALQASVNTADWRLLNKLLQPFLDEDEPAPPGWSLPASPPPPPKFQPRQPKPGTDPQVTANKKLIRRVLETTIYGPSWRKKDAATQDDLISEIYLRWLARGESGAIDPDMILVEGRKVRKERADADKTVGFGAYNSDEVGGFTSPEDAQEEGAREDKRSLLRDVLDRMADQSEAGKLQVTLVNLHLGETVFPGQPRRLTGTQPGKDLAKYHPGRSDRCPTCQAISKYVRVRGLTPAVVSRAVDDLFMKVRDEAES
jgi:hypothetical protein